MIQQKQKILFCNSSTATLIIMHIQTANQLYANKARQQGAAAAAASIVPSITRKSFHRTQQILYPYNLTQHAHSTHRLNPIRVHTFSSRTKRSIYTASRRSRGEGGCEAASSSCHWHLSTSRERRKGEWNYTSSDANNWVPFCLVSSQALSRFPPVHAKLVTLSTKATAMRDKSILRKTSRLRADTIRCKRQRRRVYRSERLFKGVAEWRAVGGGARDRAIRRRLGMAGENCCAALTLYPSLSAILNYFSFF